MPKNSEKYLSCLKETINDKIDYKKLSGKTVLITGATGLIGKALTDYLLILNDEFDLNLSLYASSRSLESFEERFEKRDNLFYFNYDLTKPVEGNIKFDYIIHAASNADPRMFASDPVGTMTSNFSGTYNLLEYARKTGCERFLFVSSGEVYGQWDGQCDSFSEDYSGTVNFSEARGCYPSSKRAAENLCVCYSEQYGVDTVTVRPSHTYGPTQKKRDSRAMSEFFQSASEGKDIVLKSMGLPVRSYTAVFDCVSGIVTALLMGKCAQAYNISNMKSVVSIADLAKLIAKCAGGRVVFDVQNPVKGAGSITRGVLNSAKLEEIGYVPKFDIEKGVKATLEIMEEEK